jgi:hypothetical protein
MNVIDMIDTLKQSPNITRLTLLSCESARASLLAEEEKSIAAFKNSQDALFSGDCGLIYMTKSPVNKVEQDKILKNQDACYVLIEENNQKTCIFLQKNANPKKIALNDEKFESCKNQLYGANKTFKIPKGGSEYQIVRGPGNYLKLSEKQYMHDVFENIEGNKFNKKNPAYKAAKNTYPFLRGVEIQSTDENEMKKLKHSLLQVVAETIKATPEIKQNVVVKGYRGLVHVDLEEGGFHNVSKPIYTKSYSSNNSPLLFGKKDNIDRPELKKQRTKQIQDMLTGEPAKIAKSIKVHIRKP